MHNIKNTEIDNSVGEEIILISNPNEKFVSPCSKIILPQIGEELQKSWINQRFEEVGYTEIASQIKELTEKTTKKIIDEHREQCEKTAKSTWVAAQITKKSLTVDDIKNIAKKLCKEFNVKEKDKYSENITVSGALLHIPGWMKHHVAAKISKKENEIKEKALSKFNYDTYCKKHPQKPPIIHHHSLVIGKTTIQFPAQAIQQAKKLQTDQEALLKTDYTAEFTQLWNEKLEATFTQAISMVSGDLLAAFHQKYPWLHEDHKKLNMASTPSYRFLTGVLPSYLLSHLEKPRVIQAWGDLTPKELTSKDGLHWQDFNSLSPAVHKELLFIYPFEYIFSHFRDEDRVLNEYEHLEAHLEARLAQGSIEKNNNKELFAYRPTRIDIFRLLSLNYPEEIKSGRIAPLSLTEAKNLLPDDWEHFTALVLNIATEEQPVWILMRKIEDQWCAYVSTAIDEKISDKINTLPQKITINNVNYSENINFDDIDLDSVTQWHAVLFGRVLPWCLLSKPDLSLENYGNTIPVLLMLESVFLNCLSNKLYDLNKHHEKVTQAFVFRHLATDDNTTPEELSEKKVLKTILPNFNMLNSELAQLTLNVLHNKQLHFVKQDELLTLNISYLTNQTFPLLLRLLCHYAPQHLHFSNIAYSTAENINVNWFLNHNGDLCEVTTGAQKKSLQLHGQRTSLHHLLECAARNRFLYAMESLQSNSSLIKDDIVTLRSELWNKAKEQLICFFSDHAALINLDFVDALQKLKQDDLEESDPFFLPCQAFQQIAQMGFMGLECLFENIEKNIDKKWKITFDLGDSYTQEPKDYIECLHNKISQLYRKHPHSPVFAHLSLILPNKINSDYIASLNNLIKLINENNIPANDCNLTLFNVNIDDPNAIELIKKLQELAKQPNLKFMVSIPTWDREAYIEDSQYKLKRAYHELQNSIIRTRQAAKLDTLSQNTESLYSYKEQKLKARVKLLSHAELQPQSWPEDQEKEYPLTQQIEIQYEQEQEIGQEISYELELQQEQEQEQQQDQQQEQQQEPLSSKWEEKPLPQRVKYKPNSDMLVTRDNIESLCKSLWDALDEETKTRYQSLSQLFSLWVGSTKKSKHIVEKIQYSAVEKIMRKENLAQFQFGGVEDCFYFFPGFYLAHEEENDALILCFDLELEQEILTEHSSLEIGERNPFIIELDQMRKPATTFVGDYQQCERFSNEPQEQQTLWKYFALEKEDPKRLENAQRVCQQLGQENIDSSSASVALQLLKQGESRINRPGDLAKAREILHARAQQFFLDWPDQTGYFLYVPFSTSSSSWNEKNLKGMGQLFQYYGTYVPEGKQFNALAYFFLIAREIYNVFHFEHFKIWKERLLDCSDNWTEFLEKTEVDAMLSSLVTLNGHEREMRAWWLLVDAHGKATGQMRYSDLWYAFQYVIAYLQRKKLSIDLISWQKYLKGNNTSLFHAKVFLMHLYSVLKKTELQFNSHKVQQNLLNDLDQKDWRYDGVYCAIVLENFPFWHNSLKFEEFTTPEFARDLDIKTELASYIPRMDPPYATLEGMKLQALRFVSHRMQFNIDEFCRFKTLLDKVVFSKASIDYLRLWIQCLAIGIDKWDGLSQAEENRIKIALMPLPSHEEQKLEMLVRASVWGALDIEQLQRQSIQMRFVDMRLFLNVLKDHPIKDKVLALALYDPNACREFINACGRALACYANFPRKASISQISEQQKAQLRKLLDFADTNDLIKNNSNLHFTPHSLFADYPWLIDSVEDAKDLFSTSVDPELIKFKKQLRSIDFAQSSYLPSAESLQTITQAVTEASSSFIENAQQTERRNQISQLVEQGCIITAQDARFRPLTDEEIRSSLNMLDSDLNINFKYQNNPLYQQFIQKHLVVCNDCVETAATQLEKLCGIFLQIDKNHHYNQLGQVLGLLITKAKDNEKSYYYSAPQLCEWLTCFIELKNFKTVFYPIDLLDELLMQAKRAENPKPVGLLQQNLYQLQENIDPSDRNLLKKAQEITELSLRSEYKPLLMKLAIHPHAEITEQAAQDALLKLPNRVWITAFYQFMVAIVEKKIEGTLEHLEQLSLFPKNYDSMNSLWERSQIKLLRLLLEEKIQPSDALYPTSNRNEMVIKIIMVQISSHVDSIDDKFKYLPHYLSNWELSELEELANYSELHTLLTPPHLLKVIESERKKQNKGNLKAGDIIHQFETGILASTPEGQSKRAITIDPKNLDILRILKTIQDKTRGFIDHKTQKTLLRQLTQIETEHGRLMLATKPLSFLLAQIKLCTPPRKFDPLQLLACLREVALRKTGVWLNSAQTLLLVYAIAYDNESVLYQVGTGEGKSIIALIRAIYFALQGKYVNIFSSKEALSLRDHEEALPVLSALGIDSYYITKNSPVIPLSLGTIGQVRFGTPGGINLWQAKHAWDDEGAALNPSRDRYISYGDECDELLLDDDTQHNDSSNEDGYDGFNPDSWVYEIAYDFFQEYKKKFKVTEKKQIVISTNNDLQILFNRLQQRFWEGVLPESRFFQTHLAPASNGAQETRDHRDEKLMELILAAFITDGFNESRYCIRDPEKRPIRDQLFTIRMAKVVIKTQVIDGATYSYLVHQFLHHMLNLLAVQRGEQPNFFIDIYRKIALSQNKKSLQNTDYYKKEGSSGTLGSLEEIPTYQSDYDINNLVNIQRNKESQTKFLATQYCNSNEDHINAIVNQIKEAKGQPLLIMCEDDPAVETIAQQVQEKLEEEQHNLNIIVDLNKNNIQESKLLPKIGLLNTVTFSARLGRGSHIPCKECLYVINASSAQSRTVRQRYGRTGRQGAPGICLDIINYKQVVKELGQHQNTYQEKLANIYEKEQSKLIAKFEKHKKLGSDKWDWLLKSEDLQKKYLNTRSLVQLKQHIESAEFMERKNNLFAILSKTFLSSLKLVKKDDKDALRKKWLEYFQKMESAWRVRLANEVDGDTQEVYEKFIAKVHPLWEAFCLEFASLKLPPDLVKTHEAKAEEALAKALSLQSSNKLKHIARQDKDMSALLEFYFEWSKGATQHYFNPEREKSARILLCGENDKDFFHLLEEFEKVSYLNESYIEKDEDEQALRRELFFKKLTKLAKSPLTYSISCKTWAQIIPQLLEKIMGYSFTKNIEKNRATRIENYLSCITKFLETFSNCKDFERNRFFQLSVTVANLYPRPLSSEFAEKLAIRISDSLNYRFDYQFDEPSFKFITSLLTISPPVTTLFIEKLEDIDFNYCMRVYDEGGRNSNNQLDVLASYLKQYAKELAAHPEIIRNLFLLTWRPQPQKGQVPYLPSPQFFSKWNNFHINQFWQFLIDRKEYVSEAEYTKLTEKLFACEYNAAFQKEVLEPFMELPSCLSIKHIVRLLEKDNLPSKNSLSSCATLLKKLTEEGKAFEKLIAHLPVHSLEQKQAWLNRLNQYIPGSSDIPENNTQFFNQLRDYLKKYDFISLNTLGIIFNISLASKIYPNANSSTIFEAAGMDKYIVAHTKRESIDSDLDKIKQAKESFMAFMIKHKMIPNLGAVPAQIQQWSNEFIARTPEQNIQFFTAISDLKYANSPLETLALIARQNKTLDVDYHSHEIFNAAYKLRENQNWGDYFSTLNNKNAHLRQGIIHHLSCGLLNHLGDPFKQECYKQYHQLVTRESSLIKPKELDPEKHYPILYNRNYENIIQITKEMQSIAKALPNAQHNTLSPQNVLNLEHDFRQQKTHYFNCGWKSSRRRAQANELFNELNAIAPGHNRDLYYKAILNRIWTTQKDLLERDGDRHRFLRQRNVKGYSRLYDITTQMFLTAAGHCLADGRVTLPTKTTWLNDLLNQQLKTHIKVLINRLPETHPLRKGIINIGAGAIDAWGPMQLANFYTEYTQHAGKENGKYKQKYMDNIKELHYLFDNIDCLMKLTSHDEPENQLLAQARAI